jgi:hypothetical protein
VRVRGPSAENKWPQNAAGQNFSDYTRLPQSGKEIAEQVRAGEQDRKKQYEWADGAGRHN